MDGRSIGGLGNFIGQGSEEEMELRRGPWTEEEDLILANYIANQGEGRWNALARCAGLKRTGKSCRLRWLNYLRPDVRRGNITPEEQLLILELHSRWGNRWSKIAQYLPGRTDNEIKNYWRTRVQKQAKQLRCDVDSPQFKAAVSQLWMPRLLERIRAANFTPTTASDPFTHPPNTSIPATSSLTTGQQPVDFADVPHLGQAGYATTPDNSASSNTTSSELTGDVAPAVLKHEEYYDVMEHYDELLEQTSGGRRIDDQSLPSSAAGYCTYNPVELDYRAEETTVGFGGEDSYATDYTWSIDDIWQWQPQFCDGF